MDVPLKTLPSGDQLPAVGLGTYGMDTDQTTESVRAALEAGYTHIDTAEGYQNEAAIGDVLTEYDRDDLFLTSKVLPKNRSCRKVL
jgi:diketogulonate reductase-like aldo/keto reductase